MRFDLYALSSWEEGRAVSKVFTLDVEPNEERSVLLRLSDQHGRMLDAREVVLAKHRTSQWEAAFDAMGHIRRMAGKDHALARALFDDLSLFLGCDVLGPELMKHLDGVHHRALVVRVPDASINRLGAAFARVPWEIARRSAAEKALLHRHLVVRAELAGIETLPAAPLMLASGEPVRVLLIFAEAPGSVPLAARLERERLLELFFRDVLPRRNVTVSVLCHGVTRARIREEVRRAGGYHVVHWSGHGHHNVLEIAVDQGELDAEGNPAKPRISGAELVGLFRDAGGFIPRVFYLSACHSGSMVSVKDWASFVAALRAGEGALDGTAQAGEPSLDVVLKHDEGYTGTALELLRAGIPAVAAMRYAVTHRYARRLARRFYRGLLADEASHAADSALALARSELANDVKRAAEYHPVDHATPLLFGAGLVRLEPQARPSAQMSRRAPKPQPLLPGSRDLDPPQGFVGRGAELGRLSREWLAPGGAPIAVVQGLAGLGKTSLAAEAIHLWFHMFDYVFAFQARRAPLSLEDLYVQLDRRLAPASPAYRQRCLENEMARIHIRASSELTGEARADLLRNNLMVELHEERILLVLDNFESNLSSLSSNASGQPSTDPGWDRLFKELSDRLQGSGSRVLVTSRRRLSALAYPKRALWLPLGPLPMPEAARFFEGQRPLRELMVSDDGGQQLAQRILMVSRGHPLILARMADMARAHLDDNGKLTPAGRAALAGAIDRITAAGYRSLPDVFAGVKSEAEREEERRYLEEVAEKSVDELIADLTPDARRLLWTLTRASEPVPRWLLKGVWSGMSLEEERKRKLASMLAEPDELPPELQAYVATMPLEVREELEQLKVSASPEPSPTMEPLLEALCGAGLVQREKGDTFAFHELVAERAAAWMEQHTEELKERTEPDLYKAYGERYGEVFRILRSSGKPGAHDQAAEAGRRGIQYLVLARSFDELHSFASAFVTGTTEPALLDAVIHDLQNAADVVPAGKARWSVRTYIANALDSAGQPDQALSFYALAVAEAEAAEHWSDLGSIYQNFAVALRQVGRLSDARRAFTQSADAEARAGNPRIAIVGSELEALRLDVMQGQAEKVEPAIEERLAEVRSWWERRQNGEKVPEAPDDEMLVRALITGLDIAEDVSRDVGQWQKSLELFDEIEAVKRAQGAGEYEIAGTRFNRYGPMLRLTQEARDRGEHEAAMKQLGEAKALLADCLDIFRRAGSSEREGRVLSALANVCKELGDVTEAISLERRALALHDRMPDLGSRASSHNNLSSYLRRESLADEANEHLIASLAYRAVTGINRRQSLGSLASSIRDADAHGERFELPRLDALTAKPTFTALRDFLAEREVDVPHLQASLDALVEQVRAEVFSSSPETIEGVTVTPEPPRGGSDSPIFSEHPCPCGSDRPFQDCHGASDE